jgi:hypothetical protein
MSGRPSLLPEEVTAKTSDLWRHGRCGRDSRRCRLFLRIVFLVFDENSGILASGVTAARFRFDRASAAWQDVMGFILHLIILLIRIHTRWGPGSAS